MEFVQYFGIVSFYSMLALAFYGIVMGVEVIDDTETEGGDVTDVAAFSFVGLDGREAATRQAKCQIQ
jgi:hypothetical protein